MKKSVLLLLSTFFFSQLLLAQEAEEPKRILFTNVNVFDGVSDGLSMNTNVLVEDNLIAAVGPSITLPEGAEVVDGGGRTLMPGLIEGHNHLGLAVDSFSWFNTRDVFYIAAAGAAEAEKLLMSGWTTVRDIGGPAMGFHHAVEDGRIRGPRIYASGPVIGQTSGHGDFRELNDPHPNMIDYTHPFYEYLSFIADGPAEVQRAVREALRRGAVQIKVMAGGGVSSSIDPLYTVQYSPAEMRAAVEAAADYGTYIAVHAYNDASIIRSAEAGVKVIEHGTLMTQAAVDAMIEHDVWLMPSCQVLNLSEEAVGFLSEESLGKFTQARDGLELQMRLIQENPDLVVGFGTDLFGSAGNFAQIPLELTCLEQYFTPFEVLRRATSINGQFLALTGQRNPYQEGPLGVIEVGAYADILLVEGNPLEGTSILVDHEENIDLIMKDGVIYKNTL